jgi:ATP-binding cassette subfamily B protein
MTTGPTPRRSIRRLGGLIRFSTRLVWRASRGAFVGLVGLQLVSAVALAGQVLAVQLTLSVILDKGSAGAGLTPFLVPVLLLALLTATTAVTGSLQGSLSRYVGESVAQSMWRQILTVSTGVGLRRFESSDFYDRLERMRSNALTRPFQVTNGVLNVIGSAAAGIGVALTIAAMLFTSRRESRLEFRFNVEQTQRIRLRTYISILLTGRDEAKEVRAFGLRQELTSRFNRLYDIYRHDLARHIRRRSRLNLLGNLAAALILALTLLALVWLITVGQIGVAGAGAAIVAIRLLASQIQSLTGGVQTIFESGLFIDDVDEFISTEDVDRAPEGPQLDVPPLTSLDLSDVRFTYPGRPELALDGVDIHVGAGEIVALVGENGSGKTTLAKIMAGLYPPDSGSVRWNGTDIAELDPSQLRDQIAIIFQDFVRYAFSAEENIGLGQVSRSADPTQVRDAARAAGADEFLSALPDGYATPLSRLFDGGHEISGGQWQRVAIARAYFRQAPLVILDEPSSALDPRAEHDLFSSLRATLEGRTALFVSHRFSTVRSADRIYVLEAGKVAEHGTHAELMARKGLYADLFTLQADAYLRS